MVLKQPPLFRSVTMWKNAPYLSDSVEMLEDITETNDEFSLTSPPENLQNKFLSMSPVKLSLKEMKSTYL